MKKIFTLLCLIGVVTCGYTQTKKNKNKGYEPFIVNMRIEAGPFYQFDHVIKNNEGIRFEAYGMHARASYNLQDIVHFSVGSYMYKNSYWKGNNGVEIGVYTTALLNPFHSLLQYQTSFFNTVRPLIGLGYEGDTFLGRQNKWHGFTGNVALSYTTNFLTVEYAFKNRVWRKEEIANEFFSSGELNNLSTVTMLFNFMSWTRYLSKRRKKVKGSFFDKGW